MLLRWHLTQSIVLLLVLGFCGVTFKPIQTAQPPPSLTRLPPLNLIPIENQHAGSTGWRLGAQIADDVKQQIKGYASAVSVNQGQPITFYVTVHPAQVYSIDIYRMGWYGGTGGRFMSHIGPLTGTPQPVCAMEPTTGLLECHWQAPSSATLTVPSSWTSGIYLAHLFNAQHYESYIIFVVRDDGRPADFLYQQPVATYQAYNNYPADGATRKSLYAHNSYGTSTIAGTSQAVKVSFDRPYAGNGDGQFSSSVLYEGYFVRWLERMGYNVTYATDLDVHTNGALLEHYKAVLVVGHSEYWSKAMYAAALTARDAGIHLAFFGADDVYWQVRFEASRRGIANRVMVCYKGAASHDPVQGERRTDAWRIVGQPEQALIGVQYGLDNAAGLHVPYVVTAHLNWIFAGTGLKIGSHVPGIVGHEIDYLDLHFPLPSNVAYTLLSRSPFLAGKGVTGQANSSLYQAPSGAWVFAAGTLAWSWGLARPGFIDRGIQRITQNILDHFIQAPRSLLVTALITARSSQAVYLPLVMRTKR